MRVLITSDWQTQRSNLQVSHAALNRVLETSRKHQVEAVVVAGDLKQKYDPIETETTLFWLSFVTRVREAGMRALLVLGNHDRIGLYNDERNWLPILEKAGAEVFWKAGFAEMGDGSKLFVLPFIGGNVRWEEANEEMGRWKPSKTRDVLVFHQTLTGSQLNKTGRVADSGMGLSVKALQPDRFKFCVGGDIHLPQQVARNVWYVGSPFPMDWGEVNQRKYFGIVTGKDLQWVQTGMPGWYDPAVRGFKAPKSWEGTRVRVQVQVAPEDDYGEKVLREKVRAEAQYPGALVTMLPVFHDKVVHDDVAATTDSEATLLQKYVQKTLVLSDDVDGVDEIDTMVAYLNYMLHGTGVGGRVDTGVRFERVWGKDFLCFKDLQLDFTRNGITVVTGVNGDWPGRSNGAGKSSLLEALSVALFGRTFKGQTADSWKRRNAVGTAHVGVEFTTAAGVRVKVERSRSPVSVKLWVNDKERWSEDAAGGKTMDVTKEVSRLCGYTWDTFAALVYLSREEVNGFLWGGPKTRQEILVKLQNQERYSTAWQQVGRVQAKTDAQLVELREAATILREKRKAYEALQSAATEVERITDELHVAQEKSTGFRDQLQQFPVDTGTPKNIRELEKACVVADETVSEFAGNVRVWNKRLSDLQNAPVVCPTCGQKLQKGGVSKEEVDKTRRALQALQSNLEEQRRIQGEKKAKLQKARAEYDTWRNDRRQVAMQLQWVEKKVEDLNKQLQYWQEKAERNAQDLQEIQDTTQQVEAAVEVLQGEKKFLAQARGILSRDGFPAYLNQMLCPKLNAAAEYFAEKFTDGQLQVRFTTEEGQLQVRVLNALGGEKLQDQSTGEKALMALMTSFTLREIAEKPNVLILDEPGDGLDEENAKMFAIGLRQLAPAWGAVFVVTHNQAIASELMGERQVCITKQGGVSSMVVA